MIFINQNAKNVYLDIFKTFINLLVVVVAVVIVVAAVVASHPFRAPFL